MIASTVRPRLIALAITAVCLSASAQTQTAPPPPGSGGGPSHDRPPMMDHGPEHRHGGRMMREVERLKTSLKLDANQTQLWDRAAALMKPPAHMREQMKARHDKMAAALDDPNFDPRRLAAEMDAAQAERTAKMKSVRDAWIAVYQSLNPVQRGQVREFLRSHMMHGPMGMHGGSDMHGPMEWHHRGGPDGKDMGAPPAPKN